MEVRCETIDGVGLITLLALERRNSLSVSMAQELVEATAALGGDPNVGAIVVTGENTSAQAQCVKSWPTWEKIQAEDRALRNLERLYRAFTSVGEAPVPTIAAIRGAAVGAGLNLALATDLRVVAKRARLLPGFAQIGVHPGGGHFTLLMRTVGREGAAALGLFGEEITGEQAVTVGMAWAAYEDDEVLPMALKLAKRVAADPDLTRRLVTAFRRQTSQGGIPWDVAVELEKAPQMWSLRRMHRLNDDISVGQ